jgi:phosphate ABC transporter substrate-binding protein, PhoT family (TC 3.A.1.7.1)
MKAKFFGIAASALMLVACGNSGGSTSGQAQSGRTQLRVVGSSTVFPFTTAVAESFGATGAFSTPIIESTGTGGGFQQFCQGVGENTADLTGASRPMRRSEFDLCAQNGVEGIIETKIGFDGIVLANLKSGVSMNITKTQLWTAVAKQVPVDGVLTANPYKNWSEVDPSLPDAPIQVFGPPPTSGTRDAFLELAMEPGARGFPMLDALHDSDLAEFRRVAHTIREDGAWIDSGENDNAIVQTLEANPTAFGVFGFSFLDQNSDKVKGEKIDGVDPSFENIASGAYGVARSMYVYAKTQHIGVIPGVMEFLREYTSETAFGEEGYLVQKGLIPLPAAERDAERAKLDGPVLMTAPAE